MTVWRTRGGVVAFALSIAGLGDVASAEELLTPVALYNRCHAQLTSTYADPSSTVVQSVKAGAVDPITACVQLLNSARFTGASNGTRIDGSPGAKAVLRTLHALHFSWFRQKEFPATNTIYTAMGAADIMDATTPAMFVTRALFAPGLTADGIFRGFDGLRAIRTVMDPANGVASRELKSRYAMTTIKFAPVGELLGIERWTDASTAFTGGVFGPAYTSASGTVDFARSLGGGVLGSAAYVLQNVNEPLSFQANGVRMPRKWARSLFNDFVCRDLPVVRRADAAAYVDPLSPISFRTSAPCTQCHVSMDRASAVLRNFRHLSTGSGAAEGALRGAEFYDLHPVNQALAATAVFPLSQVNDYHQSPPKGVLYYRDYAGALVDIEADDLDSLASALAEQDDPYICFAKRYYKYFTGIDIAVGDPGDPDRPIVRTGADRTHYERVVDLGLSLKSHGSLSRLIEDILRSEPYKWSNMQSAVQEP